MSVQNFEEAARQIREVEKYFGQPLLTPQQWGRLAAAKKKELDQMDLVEAVIYLEKLEVPRDVIRSYLIRRTT